MVDDDVPEQLPLLPGDQRDPLRRGFATGLDDGLGDFAIGYLIGAAYSDVVQHALGSTLTGEPRALLNDCLTGVWTRRCSPAAVNPRTSARSRPATSTRPSQTALVVGDPTADTNINGTAFDKIEAFRIGVLNGLDTCNAEYGS